MTTWMSCQLIAGPHTDKQPLTLTFTPRDNEESQNDLTYISFGLWEEAREPSSHRENMITPHSS